MAQFGSESSSSSDSFNGHFNWDYASSQKLRCWLVTFYISYFLTIMPMAIIYNIFPVYFQVQRLK